MLPDAMQQERSEPKAHRHHDDLAGVAEARAT
jgi:hypothetical protein